MAIPSDRVDLKGMSLEEAKRIIFESVYQASRLLEDLHVASRVSGNGHHARQKIAHAAADELESRWRS